MLRGFVWRSLCSSPMGMMDIRAGAVPSANRAEYRPSKVRQVGPRIAAEPSDAFWALRDTREFKQGSLAGI